MLSFLDTYRSSFESVLGPARLERGRVALMADGACAQAALHRVHGLARELELSCHDGSACVDLTLDPSDVLALAAMIRLVLAGELVDATLSDEHWTVSSRAAERSLRIRVSDADERSRRALRLLGFSTGGLPSELARSVEPQPFAASKVLQRVLRVACDTQERGVDAVLTSGDQVAAVDAVRTRRSQQGIGPKGRQASPQSLDPVPT